MPFGKVNKDANTKIAMVFLTRSGWTSMQAAAIVGNLTAESYLNPRTPRGDDGTAMGLAQWRNERLKKFTEIIGKHCETASLEEQLRFVDWELRNTHKKAGNLLKTATHLPDAVHIVDKYYERSAGLHLERRIKFARDALTKYGQPTEHKVSRLLDDGIEQSMDASDPTSLTQPGNNNDPVPSSGFPEKRKSIWDRLAAWANK